MIATRLAALLGLLLLGACAGPRSTDVAAQGATEYPLALLWRGRDAAAYTPEERAALQRGHLERIDQLARARTLLVAGPFGRGGPQEDLRGLYVFAPHPAADVESLVEGDPAIDARVLEVKWAMLSTDHDLAAALERHDAAVARVGATADRMATMREYTVVFSADADAVEAALRGRVDFVLKGRLDGGPRGFHVIDDDDAASVAALLAPLGKDCEVYPWFGSASLPAPTAR